MIFPIFSNSLTIWFCLVILASNFRYSRGVLSPERHVRTRLYFTSESHVHSLLSILRYGALCNVSGISYLYFSNQMTAAIFYFTGDVYTVNEGGGGKVESRGSG